MDKKQLIEAFLEAKNDFLDRASGFGTSSIRTCYSELTKYALQIVTEVENLEKEKLK